MSSTKRPVFRILGITIGLILILAACGDEEDGELPTRFAVPSATSTQPPDTPEPSPSPTDELPTRFIVSTATATRPPDTPAPSPTATRMATRAATTRPPTTTATATLTSPPLPTTALPSPTPTKTVTAVPATPIITPHTPTGLIVVVPQASQPDGSVIHVVEDGNTIEAIAVAYGVEVADILALNPELGDGSILYIGQTLLIRPAPGEN